MKYLILYPDEYEFSALTIQAKLLARGLKENGHEVRCLCVNHTFSKKLEYATLKPDAVIGVGFWGNTKTLIEDPIKHGLTAVPWFNANGWIANHRETLNQLPLLLVTSGWVNRVYQRDGIRPDNIRPLHVGIDATSFRPLPKDHPKVSHVREMLGVKPHELMILTAGGDATSKGAQEMFRGIAKMKGELPPFKYVCKSWPSHNTNEWRQMETELLDNLGIRDHIIFHDEVIHHEDMPFILNACDIYAAPSRLEGFGMIQVEAMACGKPVISINEMGPAETIIHGKTGFLADVGQEIKLDKEWVGPDMGYERVMQIEFPNPKTFAYRANTDQLADFTQKLLTDANLREEMGQAAAKHALENFHYTVIAKKMVDLLQEHLLKKP
ncbi:MAG: glycosyltransferase family 4 protein [archaeon]